MAALAREMISTANEIAGWRVVRHLGIVRGITVRSRSVIGNFGAALQTLVGGNITLFTELCERARGEAYDLMVQHAGEMGANAIIAMRYDANEVAQGVTEVLAYGTAVVVEPARLARMFSTRREASSVTTMSASAGSVRSACRLRRS